MRSCGVMNLRYVPFHLAYSRAGVRLRQPNWEIISRCSLVSKWNIRIRLRRKLTIWRRCRSTRRRKKMHKQRRSPRALRKLCQSNKTLKTMLGSMRGWMPRSARVPNAVTWRSTRSNHRFLIVEYTQTGKRRSKTNCTKMPFRGE